MKDYSRVLTVLEQSGLPVKKNVRLSDYTTFKIGGPCPLLVECRQPEELVRVVRVLHGDQLPFFLIGGGSNLVVSDQGLDAVVIRFFSDQPQIKISQESVTVIASTKLDDLALCCAQQGLAGLNFATGIYGTVGGAIAGNAGAFGQQVSDRLKSVHLLTAAGEKKEVGASQLEFSYRDSILKRNQEIVLQACFVLGPGNRETLLEDRREILELRRQKHPDVNSYPSAGSIFRNLKPTSQAGRRQAAGWLLEQVGAKDMKVGGAAVFEKHANIIVNTGQATANDVHMLTGMLAQSVYEKFKIELNAEVCFVGDFSNLSGE